MTPNQSGDANGGPRLSVDEKAVLQRFQEKNNFLPLKVTWRNHLNIRIRSVGSYLQLMTLSFLLPSKASGILTLGFLPSIIGMTKEVNRSIPKSLKGFLSCFGERTLFLILGAVLEN